MSVNDELLELSQKLLNAIDEQDWSTYKELCDDQLTAFEPEANGQRVVGMPFHKFYFDTPSGTRKQSSIVSPDIKVIGDAAVITYIRLTQVYGGDKTHSTKACEETRIWQRVDSQWKHIHFHRSAV